jgi:hypothetical protein
LAAFGRRPLPTWHDRSRPASETLHTTGKARIEHMISASRPTADIAALGRANWNDETTVPAMSTSRRKPFEGPELIASTFCCRRALMTAMLRKSGTPGSHELSALRVKLHRDGREFRGSLERRRSNRAPESAFSTWAQAWTDLREAEGGRTGGGGSRGARARITADSARHPKTGFRSSIYWASRRVGIKPCCRRSSRDGPLQR